MPHVSLASPTSRFAGRLAAPAVLLALAAGCAPAPPLYATEAAPAVVDGDAREWPAALRPVPREGGLRIGLRTTDDALYVVVVAGDERQKRRISAGGLRLWLDPAGGTERVLGVGFPLPAPPGLARGGTIEQRRFSERLGRLTLQRGEGPVQTFDLGRLEGIETAAEWTSRALVVEYRVPLGDGPMAVVPSGALGVGVELLDTSVGVRRAPAGRGGAAEDAGPTATVTRWLRVETGA